MVVSRFAPLKGVGRSRDLLASTTLRRLLQARNHSHTSIDISKAWKDGSVGAPPLQKIQRTKPRPRFPKFLPVSPNHALVIWLRRRNAPLSLRKWHLFRQIASSRSLRLPVMTAQMLMRQEEARAESSLSECFSDLGEWRARLNSLAFKGITEDHINHWIWILSAESDDAKIERFVSTNHHKPLFVLLTLLRHDATFHEGKNFICLLDYIACHYVRPRAVHEDAQVPRGAVRRSLDNHLNMSPIHFSRLLRALVLHCLRVLPTSIISISQLVTAYIDTIPLKPRSKTSSRGSRESGHAKRCRVFNYALQLFQQSSSLRPLAQMQYHWQAQKELLAFSTRLERHLIITRLSYQAIRKVLIGLPKSPAEQKVAMRSSKTWPPYRREWDGVDERRTPEDDLSRSVKSGRMMKYAGYAEDEYDFALGALGGAVQDEPPTIQTRSVGPKRWEGKLAHLQIFSTWAAKVRATRNAHEAWRMLRSPPRDGLKPNFQVYAEMFEKLFAQDVDHASSVLPGDAKEVFPVQDVNLTAFEKARLQPPDVEELYRQMLHDGNRPVGRCLVILIENATSVEMGLRYLQDSPFKGDASCFEIETPTHEMLRQIPLPIFNAFISLLCHLQPCYSASIALHSRGDSSYIHRAIKLIGLRLGIGPASPERRIYKAPWHTALGALARPEICISTSGKPRNDFDALDLFLKVYDRAVRLTGPDVVMFEHLCRVVQKVGRFLARFRRTYGAAMGISFAETARRAQIHYRAEGEETFTRAHSEILAAFRCVTQPTETGPPGDNTLQRPRLYHQITAPSLFLYMRALAFLGDSAEMARVIDWIFDSWEHDTILEDAKTRDRGRRSMTRALCLFRAYAEPLLPPAEVQRLELRAREMRQACLAWPDEVSVADFVRSDNWYGSDALWGDSRKNSVASATGPRGGEWLAQSGQIFGDKST